MIGIRTSTRRCSQRGVSLVELMIAMAVGLLLLAGTMQIFSSSQATNHIQQALSRNQEAGRFAVQFLSRDVRMAGYTGCPPGSLDGANRIYSIANGLAADNQLRGDRFVGGTRGEDWSEAPTSIAVNQASDVLIIQHAGSSQGRISDDKPAGANLNMADNRTGFTKGEIVFLTDCETADIFGVTAVSTSAGNSSISHGSSRNSATPPHLHNRYESGSMVMRFVRNTYFIGTRSGANAPSLYRTDVRGNVRELVEGVERMRIQYGVDGSGNGAVDGYRHADDVSDWGKVIAVRIALLTRSRPAFRRNRSRTFTLLDDAPLSFNDRRLRQVFSTTIALRNRTH